jgi:sugar lactone lactonase YvrE
VRRLVFLCALAVIASAVVAHSLPRGTGEASAPSGAAQVNGSGGAANAPVVISTGLRARSLAVASTTPTAENPGDPSLYLTVSDKPNQVFALSPAASIAPLNSLPSVAARLAPIAGVGETGSLGDGGAAIAAQLDLKLDSLLMRSGVAVASDGTIFIADTRNSTIRRIAGPASSEPGVIRSIVGRWAPRQEITLVEPMGIALDPAGNLYIADHAANQVLLVRAATSQTPDPVQLLAHVAQPASISSAPDGSKIFVASPENRAVFALDPRTHEIQAIAALVGQSSSCPGSQTPNGISPGLCPTGLAVDGGGNLFIADAAANHILRVDARTAAVSVALTQLASPGEINFDTGGDLFVADQGHDRVVESRKLGQPVNTVSLSPASNDFGVEPTGGTSPPAAFTLTNGTSAGLTDLVINNFQGANPGDFQTQSSSCTSMLPANSSCTINVVFVPSSAAARSAQLVVTYAGGTNLTANLTGVGADYELALAGTQNMSVTVIAGTSATYNLQLTPDANFPANSPYTVTFVSPAIASPTSSSPPAGDLPALTSASFSPSSVTVTPGKVVPFTFTIETTSRISGVLGSVPVGLAPKLPSPPRQPHSPALLLIVAAVAAFLAAHTAASHGAKRLRLGSFAALFLVAAGLIAGCGGGRHAIVGTQPGTSNFLVQATVQNASGVSLNAARGIPLQLVVQ